MNRLWVVGLLIISTAPLYAQDQKSDAAKLKADAQKVVSLIAADKAKIETFCQMEILDKALNKAIQEKDTKKAGELAQRITDGDKQLGPEYGALVESLESFDLSSKDGQEIVSMFDAMDESCPH